LNQLLKPHEVANLLGGPTSFDRTRQNSPNPIPASLSAQPQWLTATEAAGYLRIEPRTLLSWARQGKVKGYVLSGTRRITWRFLRSDLDAKLQAPAVLSTTGGLNERAA
jgi:excisionase family DNA binding protein